MEELKVWNDKKMSLDYLKGDKNAFEMELFLDISVSLRILELKEKGGPTEEDFKRVGTYQQLIGEKGNFLWVRAKKEGVTAEVSNAVADAISVLSFCSGGVTIFGRHWES